MNDFLKIIPENIPQILKEKKRWALWRAKPNKEKPDKIPYQIDGKLAKSNDPETWNSFEIIFNSYSQGGYDGISYALEISDKITGIDLDKSINGNGKPQKWANEIIKKINTYTEISPSGKGLRAFAFGDLPKGGRKKGDIEVYNNVRFLTVTGHHLKESPLNVESRQNEINAFHSKYFPKKQTVTQNTKPSLSTDLNMHELLQQARKSKKGQEFQSFYDNGDFSGYPSQSEADQALCNMLAFWLNKDFQAIDQTFRDSALMRDKWDAPARQGETYGQGTIQNAINATQETYQEWLRNNQNSPKDKQPAKIEIDENDLAQKAQRILDKSVPCEKFDISTLPPILSQYINELCETTDAEPIIITQSVLSSISALLGKKIFISNYFQNLYPNLWMCSIAPSGSFKTTAINKGATIVYKKLEKIKEETREYKKTHQDSHGNWKNKEKTKEYENEVLQILTKNVLLPDKTTAEGLLEHLSQGYQGVINLSEFGEWLQTLEKSYNGSLKGLFTDLFDVPQLKQYKTKTGGLLEVEKPYISINAVSTIEWVNENITKKDVKSGFFARFLLFYPPQEEKIPPAFPVAHKERNLRLENQVIETIENIKNNKDYYLPTQSLEYFTEIHNNLYEAIKRLESENQTILEPYVKRWSPYILKLALLFQPFYENETNQISIQALESAVSIIDYAIKSTTYLFQNELGETENQKKCRKILNYIAKQNGQVIWGKLLNSHTLDGGAKDYEYITDTLEQQGKIEVKPNEIKAKRIIILSGDDKT